MSSNENKYLNASRVNVIIRAVNAKIPKDKAGLKNALEEKYYDDIWRDAQNHQKRYGKWPAFDLMELEYDDPDMDIYSTSAEEWANDRKKNRQVDELDEI